MNEDKHRIPRETIIQVLQAAGPYIRIEAQKFRAALVGQNLGNVTDFQALVEEHDATLATLIVLVEAALSGAEYIDPAWTQQRITRIEHYTSGSGNPTWKCALDGTDQMLYIRQSNKAIFSEHYPALENMALGDVATHVDITVYTEPDGDFLKPVKVLPDGKLAWISNLDADVERKRKKVAHDE